MTTGLWLLFGLGAVSLGLIFLQWGQLQQLIARFKGLEEKTANLEGQRTKTLLEFNNQLLGKQMEGFKLLQESMQTSMQQLSQSTDKQLNAISDSVEKRLSKGFEKTTETFANVMKRLALIDEAQKKITELSTNVVSLQDILNDKRSRGAFGEVQLTALLRNVLPEASFSLQHTLSNGKRPDCFLFLPPPTGNIAIDAKFPLETFRRLSEVNCAEGEKRRLEQQFRQDIKTHIMAIAEKYLIANETGDGALMFIPAEAVFAEIHAHYPDLVTLAQKQRVWMVSPTTMMAILTTARAVLKDADTRKHVHVIQEHLGLLARDFERFEKRMDNLGRHIAKAHEDVESVHTSARKIASRFSKIEHIELSEDPKVTLPITE